MSSWPAPALRALALVSLLAAAPVAAATGSGPNPARRARLEQKYFDRALQAFDRGRYAESRRILEALVKARPTSGLFWFNLGNARLKQKDRSGAAEGYRKVVDLDSPLAPAASLYLAKIQRMEGRLQDAVDWLKWTVRSKLPPALARAGREERLSLQAEAMRLGVNAYRASQFQAAIPYFEIAMQPDGDPQLGSQAGLMKALALLKAGQPERALAQLDRITAEGSAAQGVRDFARDFSRIEREAITGESDTWFYGDLAFGFNSNLAGSGTGDGAIGKPIMPVAFGGGWRFHASGENSWSLGGSLSWEEVGGIPSSRYVRNALWVQFRNQGPAWQVQVTPQIELSVLGSDLYLARAPVSLSVQRFLGRERLGMALSAAKIAPASSPYGYLAGTSWSARGFWLRQGRSWVAGPNLSLAQENVSSLALGTGSLPLAYTSFGPGVSGFWVPRSHWELNGSASYAWKNYSDLSQPGGIERDDRVLALYGRVTYRGSPEMAPYVEFDITVNSSTLDASTVDDRNYSRFVVLTGLSWDLL
jgi:tetratricopeptide (TPR) repeat protein